MSVCCGAVVCSFVCLPVWSVFSSVLPVLPVFTSVYLPVFVGLFCSTVFVRRCAVHCTPHVCQGGSVPWGSSSVCLSPVCLSVRVCACSVCPSVHLPMSVCSSVQPSCPGAVHCTSVRSPRFGSVRCLSPVCLCSVSVSACLVCLFIFLPACLFICSSVCSSVRVRQHTSCSAKVAGSWGLCLSACLSVVCLSVSACLPFYTSTCLPVCSSVRLVCRCSSQHLLMSVWSGAPSSCLPVCLSVSVPVSACSPIHTSTYLPVCLSVIFVPDLTER
jgi:hypothetical protein